MHKGSKKDYYEILGVTKSATTDEIKKAYKKLAIKWHPDKNPGKEKEAEEMFKIIAEAYSVLADPKKRQNYDNYGTPDFDGGVGRGSNSGFGGFGGFDDFEGFGFGGSRKPFGGSFGGFSFERAEEIFREAFGNDFRSGFGDQRHSKKGSNNRNQARDPFFDDDDFFMGGSRINNIMKNFGLGRDPFFDNDDFFGGGFGGGFGSGFAQMQSVMSGGSGNGFAGQSKSVSTSTIIKNGKKVTVTKTTVRNADGTSHTEVHEKVQDEGRTLKDERYAGEDHPSRLGYRSNSGYEPNPNAIGYKAKKNSFKY